MKFFVSLFTLKLPVYYVYMLQQVEYNPSKFWAWTKRLIKQNKQVSEVMTRKTLVYTSRAKILLILGYTFFVVGFLIILFLMSGMPVLYILGITIIWLVIAPLYLILFMYCLSGFAYLVIVKPGQQKALRKATEIFKNHKAIKIAVLGSYGKTTIKELLNAVLSEGKKVAVTPGNMNVTASHAKFAKKLVGDEDIIIVEFGEGEPGDIARMASMLNPDYAVITGLAPNHLDFYPNIDAVAEDLLEIYNFVEPEKVYVNAGSEMLRKFLNDSTATFDEHKMLGWTSKNIKVNVDSLEFDIESKDTEIKVNSGLLGRHQVGPLMCCAVLASNLGLSNKEIEQGLSKTRPYEHRMQPRQVQGAWLIDDTYNGNLEGLQAGLRLLSELPAKRKWYVTPGLVDQGNETEKVHLLLGKAIAESKPDIVVLMENSVRPIIQKSMEDNDFGGELRVEKNPLDFYTNIEHLIAVGDIVLMQNDWTDNYN